jgi:hypothetical protein
MRRLPGIKPIVALKRTADDAHVLPTPKTRWRLRQLYDSARLALPDGMSPKFGELCT